MVGLNVKFLTRNQEGNGLWVTVFFLMKSSQGTLEVSTLEHLAL